MVLISPEKRDCRAGKRNLLAEGTPSKGAHNIKKSGGMARFTEGSLGAGRRGVALEIDPKDIFVGAESLMALVKRSGDDARKVDSGIGENGKKSDKGTWGIRETEGNGCFLRGIFGEGLPSNDVEASLVGLF